MPLQLKDETSRVEAEEKEEKAKAKEKRKAEKEWEASREMRVGGWRDFMTKKGSSEYKSLEHARCKALVCLLSSTAGAC